MGRFERKAVTGRIHFRWTSPRRGIFSDHSLRTNLLFVGGGALLFAGALMIKVHDLYEDETGALHYSIAAAIGLVAWCLLLGFCWLAERIASRREITSVTFDDRGAWGVHEGQEFDIPYQELHGFDISQAWGAPNRLVHVVYLFPTGARTCFERDQDGEIIFEERYYENVISFQIAPEIDRDALRVFLQGRIQGVGA